MERGGGGSLRLLDGRSAAAAKSVAESTSLLSISLRARRLLFQVRSNPYVL
jgi:hypothetical protein